MTTQHKCVGVRTSISVGCSCGWHSVAWVGKGARENAYAEWRSHRDKEHSKETTEHVADRHDRTR